MPAAHQQPLLLATCAFYLAMQLMPAAQLPAKYLCLLLAMQRKGNRGGTSSKQHMQQQKATGEATVLARFSSSHKQGRQKERQQGWAR
jgi:hypothetical protein